MVTANAPVGIPSKKDYINFGSDSALMSLIGNGKSALATSYRIVFECLSQVAFEMGGWN